MAPVEEVYTNGEGRLHRTDGPAVEHPDGRQEWWYNGKLHRTDGPAIIHGGGSDEKLWFIHGRRLTEAEFNIKKEWTIANLSKIAI